MYKTETANRAEIRHISNNFSYDMPATKNKKNRIGIKVFTYYLEKKNPLLCLFGTLDY